MTNSNIQCYHIRNSNKIISVFKKINICTEMLYSWVYIFGIMSRTFHININVTILSFRKSPKHLFIINTNLNNFL